MLASNLNDFFYKTNISEWSCKNVVKYYQKNISQHETLKKIFYEINIELKHIAQNDSGNSCGKMSQYIIDNWKVCLGTCNTDIEIEGDKVLFFETKGGN